MKPREEALLSAAVAARQASEAAMRANSYLDISVSDDRDLQERRDLIKVADVLRNIHDTLRRRAHEGG